MAGVEAPTRRGRRHGRRRRAAAELGAEHDARWLETHVWHAKRMHMALRWGRRLALRPSDKGERALLRAATHLCAARDTSHCVWLRLDGPGDALAAALRRVTHAQASPTPLLASVRTGARAAHGVKLYAPDCYPRRLVAPVSALWTPSSASGNADDLTLWLIVHAAAADDALAAMQAAVDGVPARVSALRDELLHFEVRGPRAAAMLDAVLQPLSLVHEPDSVQVRQRDEWREWRAQRSVGSLPDGAVLPLCCVDPRIAWPPRRTVDGAARERQMARERANPRRAVSAVPRELLRSPLWNDSERRAYREQMDSQHQINRVRSGMTDAEPSSLRAPMLPAVLIVHREEVPSPAQFRGTHAGLGGFDLVLPRGAGAGVWKSLVFAGARAIGLENDRAITNEQGLPYYPYDFIET